MAGLDPAIHVGRHFSMDHRVKPGGDEAIAAQAPAAPASAGASWL
jgi:hypothetical protein